MMIFTTPKELIRCYTKDDNELQFDEKVLCLNNEQVKNEFLKDKVFVYVQALDKTDDFKSKELGAYITFKKNNLNDYLKEFEQIKTSDYLLLTLLPKFFYKKENFIGLNIERII